jgi:hypothetical protein
MRQGIGAQLCHGIQHITVDHGQTPDGARAFLFNVGRHEVAASRLAILGPFHPRGQRIEA